MQQRGICVGCVSKFWQFEVTLPDRSVAGVFLIGSGYRSASRPSFLKTYLSSTHNVTQTNKCAVDSATLARNVLNHKSEHKSLET